MVLTATPERICYVEDLSFAHWQYAANEKAYANKIITTSMYEFAKEKLQKKIDNLSELCYIDRGE
jgi:uncharacterized protein YpiB (UPF0302 family)